MLRDLLIERGIGEKGGFRWRSHEVSRTEGLSDAVFGFAITLLVVSLDVPRDFTELANRMRGFLAFAISFAMLAWIWFEQHKYFQGPGVRSQGSGGVRLKVSGVAEPLSSHPDPDTP
jgi:hypothetical protein